MLTVDWDRYYKNQVRRILTQRQGRWLWYPARRTVLLMPSNEALDASAARDSGELSSSRKSKLYAVEINQGIHDRMLVSLRALRGFRGQIISHLGPVERITENFVGTKYGNPQFDWFILDSCGTLTRSFFDGIDALLRDHTAPRARLGFVFNCAARGPEGGGIARLPRAFRKPLQGSKARVAIDYYPGPHALESCRNAQIIYGAVVALVGLYFDSVVTDAIMYRDGTASMLALQFALKGRKGRNVKVKLGVIKAKSVKVDKPRGLAAVGPIERKLAGQRARLTYALNRGQTARAKDARRQIKALLKIA